MSTPSDLRTLVLHGLRLKGFGEADAVAEAVAIDETQAKAMLEELVGEGLCVYRDGRLSGFALSPAGRELHARLLADELDAVGVRADVEGAYMRFLGCNAELLSLCTAWQLRDVDGKPTLNDHTDAGYDTDVVDQLGSLHARALPICEELASALDRYASYGPRLTHALERIRAGDVDWFTKPMIPSYHTVWFELHEDLLATLGIDRSAEVGT